MKRILIAVFAVLMVFAGCRQLSVPTKAVTAGDEISTPTITPTPVSTVEGGVPLDTPVLIFGEFGEDPGKLLRPIDIEVGNNGNVYVADSGKSKIVKFNSSGVFLTEWGA
ncbi:MAG TPA: hypothetical protein ENN43_01915 [bacterium]|nr:hypothetical protein [bacterium]